MDKVSNKIRKNIPSILIAKELLEQLCKILDGECTQTQSSRTSYKFISKKAEIIKNSSKIFLEYYLPKFLKKVEFNYTSKRKAINISIDFDRVFLSKFTVVGDDPTWVSVTAKRIESVFETFRTRNEIFHTRWSIASLIYGALSSIIIYFTVYWLYRHNVINEAEYSFEYVYLILFVLLIIPYSFGFNVLFKWLFPQYTTNLHAFQIRFRYWVIIGIMLVILVISILA